MFNPRKAAKAATGTSAPDAKAPVAPKADTITIAVSPRWGMERARLFKQAVEHFQETAPQEEHACGFTVVLD